MNEADRPQLAKWLTAASEVYDRPVSEAGLEVWWNLLRPFQTPAVERAFRAHLSDPDTGRFFPRPADIIGRITGGSEAQAFEAWSKLTKAIRRYGGNSSVAFDDPLIHASVDALGGWIRLCLMRDDEQPYRQRDFLRIYTAYRQRGERPRYSGVLYGRYDSETIHLIGDEHKARLTIDNGAAVDTGGRMLPGVAATALLQTRALPPPDEQDLEKLFPHPPT